MRSVVSRGTAPSRRSRRALLLAGAALFVVGGACTDRGTGTDVQGIQATRSAAETVAPSDPIVVPSDQPSEPEASEPEATESSEPAAPETTPPAPPPTSEPAPPSEPAATTEPPATQPPATQEPTTAPPTEPTPSPSPSPTPPPSSQLRSGRGWSFTTWIPEREGRNYRWTEASATPPITPDDPDGTRAWPLRTDLRDLERPEGEAPRRRDATCASWIQAPHDEGVEARGTIWVYLLVGNETVSSGAFEADTIVAPGGRLELPDLPPVTVDAADERDVTCSVRFERN